jgi:DNA invertase Pin-like site-specific DNA recombinase
MVREANARTWRPAIYARLSDEDKDAKTNGVSMSIEHQIDILTGFVKDKGWKEPKIFYDDDRTGTNFDRKGFQDMYAEAQRGGINVIVIKDTSRFGRNWVKSGDYFERIEAMGIRFISIQEGIDTIDPKCPALKMLPFYFIFNEWHSATTSEKIRAVFSKQAEQGKHRSYHAPYGYEKDPNDKYRLVVDPIAAPVVKRIFEMRLQKMSFGSIARILNGEGVLSPSGYSAGKYGITNKKARLNKWSAGSVIQVTNNPSYCGDVAQNRVGCASYKNQKQVRKPTEEWVIVRDMHEPLVSREDWQKCADMRENLGRVRSTKYEDVSPFTGLLLCRDCGYKMQRTGTYYDVKSTGERKLLIAYNCGAYANMGKTACSSHYILENDLKELLLADIREKAGEVLQDEKAARERFFAIKAQSSGTRLNIDRNALKKVNRRLAELEKLLRAAFEKSVLGGEMSEIFTEYALKYEAEKQELTKQAKQLTASIEQQSQTENDVETFIALMKKYVSITELDRATAVELIDHITISASAVNPREIVVYYNFIGNVEQHSLRL